MGPRLWLIAVLLACNAAGATAEDHTKTTHSGAAHNGEKNSHRASDKDVKLEQRPPLDRVAIAVDGAESSHGQNLAMWRSDPSGPQGPMQVSEAAATDVGGGDRFDIEQNRVIGRAYLALLYQRYGNWPDAIAAYNWGIGRMDAWLKAGRPPDKLDGGVAVYLRRVLNDSGLCTDTIQARPAFAATSAASRSLQGAGDPSERVRPAEPAAAPPDRLISAACSAGDIWRGASSVGLAPSRFVKKLEQALQLATLRAARSS
jgi:Transglycosylase SLT domain